jgi:outer membrane protein TolC
MLLAPFASGPNEQEPASSMPQARRSTRRAARAVRLAMALAVPFVSWTAATASAQENPAGARPSVAPPAGLPATDAASAALGALAGGVPTGEATPGEIPLTLRDAIERGLRSNLGAILGSSAVEAAEASRSAVTADLLPQVRGAVAESRQKINLEAFGLTIPGQPPLVGPFNVFDARAYVQQSILDLRALHRRHAATDSLEAARQDQASARDLVVLACGQLYLQALAGEARIAAARAQLETSEALLGTARDRRSSGLGAGIEVLRADVQAQAQRQRLIVAEQDAAKQKLALARAIGLPLGQRFRLADPMPFVPAPPITAEEAIARAMRDRSDLKAAAARVEAAEEARKAARGEGLPTVGVGADYGAIGNTVSGALVTYTVAGGVRVPVFEGGRVSARVREAEARASEARARLDDLRARIYYEVQAVMLDIRAAEDRVRVTDNGLALARQQLEQSRDRFAAGVADNLEVVQAQEALAGAAESRIASLYAHNVARFSLARVLGGAEASYTDLVKGQ